MDFEGHIAFLQVVARYDRRSVTHGINFILIQSLELVLMQLVYK